MKSCRLVREAGFVAAVLLLAIPLVEYANSLYVPGGNVKGPEPAGRTLLVEIYSTPAVCTETKVNFRTILNNLLQIAQDRTQGMVVILSADCTTVYLERAQVDPYHRGPSYTEIVLVKFSTTESSLPRNTTNVFDLMRESIQEEFGGQVYIEYDLTLKEKFYY